MGKHDKEVTRAYVQGPNNSQQEVIEGRQGVNRITYHVPDGEGDKHYVDIVFDNGRKVREFGIATVLFKDTVPVIHRG